MPLLRVWIALGLVAACAADAAVIYKWTDADGVVHYSDQSVPGAEKIVTSSSSSNGIPVADAASRPVHRHLRQESAFARQILPMRDRVAGEGTGVLWRRNYSGAPETRSGPQA